MRRCVLDCVPCESTGCPCRAKGCLHKQADRAPPNTTTSAKRCDVLWTGGAPLVARSSAVAPQKSPERRNRGGRHADRQADRVTQSSTHSRGGTFKPGPQRAAPQPTGVDVTGEGAQQRNSRGAGVPLREAWLCQVGLAEPAVTRPSSPLPAGVEPGGTARPPSQARSSSRGRGAR